MIEGTELAERKRLVRRTLDLGILCRPAQPQQRKTHENRNDLLRQYLLKEMSPLSETVGSLCAFTQLFTDYNPPRCTLNLKPPIIAGGQVSPFVLLFGRKCVFPMGSISSCLHREICRFRTAWFPRCADIGQQAEEALR